MRVGYQISFDVVTHRANMAAHRPADPVVVLTEILPAEQVGWQRTVRQVRCLGPAWSEYGWGPERAHQRGVRAGASFWIYTESPVEFLDAESVWHRAP